jgi:hypothetical protein
MPKLYEQDLRRRVLEAIESSLFFLLAIALI